MKGRFMVPLALAIAAASALPAEAQAQTAGFRLGGVEFELPLPKGFCPPAGRAIDAAQIAAAADKDNVTNLSLFPCGDDGSAANYYLVKTPKNLIATEVTREQMLASIGAEFDNPEFAALLASGKLNQDTAKTFTEMTQLDVSLTGQIKALGRDDTCGYMGGVLTFKAGALNYSRAIGVCITAVSGRVIFVYRYGEGEPANVLKLLPVAKAFALSMKGKPAQ